MEHLIIVLLLGCIVATGIFLVWRSRFSDSQHQKTPSQGGEDNFQVKPSDRDALADKAVSAFERYKKAINFIREYEFPAIVKEKVKLKYQDITDGEYDDGIFALKQYFVCSYLANGSNIAMPSKVADEIWHQFILCTLEYTNFCQTAFGSYLHHSPNDSSTTDEQIDAGLMETWKQCEKNILNSSRPFLLFELDSYLGMPTPALDRVKMLIEQARSKRDQRRKQSSDDSSSSSSNVSQTDSVNPAFMLMTAAAVSSSDASAYSYSDHVKAKDSAGQSASFESPAVTHHSETSSSHSTSSHSSSSESSSPTVSCSSSSSSSCSSSCGGGCGS